MREALFVGPISAVAPRQRSAMLHDACLAAGLRPFDIDISKDLSLDATLIAIETALLARDPALAVVMLGPFAQALVSGASLRRLFGVPTIFDMRDPWLSNPYLPSTGRRGWPGRTVSQVLQKVTLAGAPAIAGATRLRQVIAGFGAEAITVLTGCDDSEPPGELLRAIWRQSIGLRSDDRSRVVFYAGKIGGRQYPIDDALSAIATSDDCRLVIATPSRVSATLEARATVLGTIDTSAVRCWHRSADISFVGEGYPDSPHTEHSVPVKVFDLLADAEYAVGWLPRVSEGSQVMKLHNGFRRVEPPEWDQLLEAIRDVPPKSGPAPARHVPVWLTRSHAVEQAGSLLRAVLAT